MPPFPATTVAQVFSTELFVGGPVLSNDEN
jgi:hypothetical protein